MGKSFDDAFIVMFYKMVVFSPIYFNSQHVYNKIQYMLFYSTYSRYLFKSSWLFY